MTRMSFSIHRIRLKARSNLPHIVMVKIITFLPTHLIHGKWVALMSTKVHIHILARLSFSQLSRLKAILPTINILQSRDLMPDTSLSWMRVKSGCLLLHQESNAEPMEKAIAQSAFLKPTNSKSAPSR